MIRDGGRGVFETSVKFAVLAAVLYFLWNAGLFGTWDYSQPQDYLAAIREAVKNDTLHSSTVLQTITDGIEAATRPLASAVSPLRERANEAQRNARETLDATMEQALAELFAELDKNGDGVIQREEFTGMTLSAWAAYRATDLALRSSLSLPTLADARARMQAVFDSVPALSDLRLLPDQPSGRDGLLRRYVLFLIFVQLLCCGAEYISAWLGWPRRWHWPERADPAEVPTVGKDICLSYDTPLQGWYEVGKTALFTLSGMFILRLLQAVFFFILGLLCVNAAVVLPSQLWYRAWLRACQVCIQFFLFSFGFYRVSYEGKIAPRHQVKLLVGNHCAVLEVVILFGMCFPSFVSNVENLEVPLFAGLVRASDAILVDKSSKRSRRRTMTEIRRRWADPQAPHLMIFPEGTIDNQRGLFKFNSGAFEAQQPVQPVCFKFPYKHFNPCWSGRVTGGNDVGDLLWRLTCQFVNRAEVKVLPVYQPTLEEQGDPRLYARRVQRLMAAHLGCPVSDCTYEDYAEKQSLYSAAQHAAQTRQQTGWKSMLRGKGGAHRGTVWFPFIGMPLAGWREGAHFEDRPALSSDDDEGAAAAAGSEGADGAETGGGLEGFYLSESDRSKAEHRDLRPC
eukprot:TRINITY_DN1970_c1_g1_i1.p1 TRINITY_DN1970_c1_g1~~TRINITY_DN1970_c1_g1_i1.p1  ORF type:complete len:656 (+),score=224.10 TRINITY_DN1970_c1_g1_i1:98-1969(+)